MTENHATATLCDLLSSKYTQVCTYALVRNVKTCSFLQELVCNRTVAITRKNTWEDSKQAFKTKTMSCVNAYNDKQMFAISKNNVKTCSFLQELMCNSYKSTLRTVSYLTMLKMTTNVINQ